MPLGNGHITQAAITSGNCTFAPPTDLLLLMLRDSSDVNRERLSLALYLFGHAINLATQNTSFRTYITTKITQANPVYSIVEMANQNQQFASYLGQVIDADLDTIAASYSTYGGLSMSSLADSTNGQNAIQNIANLMYYGTDIYYPAIGVFNPGQNTNYQYINTALGEEVTEDEVIPGWDMSGDPLLIGETTASNCSDALLLVSAGYNSPSSSTKTDNDGIEFLEDPNVVYSPGRIDGSEKEITSRSTGFQLNLKAYQIKHPFYFERRKNNLELEALFTYFRFKVDAGNTLWSRWKKRVNWRSVKHSDIFFISELASTISMSKIETLNNLFIPFYERDWYVLRFNFKPITVICNNCYNGVTSVRGEVPTALHNEFYQVWVGGIFNLFPNVGSVIDRTNEKSRFRVRRSS